MDRKQLFEEMQKTWREFKEVLARQDAETKKHGEVSAETKALVEKLNTKLSDVETRIGAIEAKDKRPPLEPGVPGKGGSEAKSAFMNWARYGVISPEEQKFLTPWQPGPEERRALTVANPTAAGYLAPVEYVREILKGIVEYSPLREVARVRTTSARAIQVPKRTGVFAAQWVAEQGTRSETAGLTFGLEEIPTHEMYALVDVSMQQLEDSAFDLETLLNEEFSEQFGVAEGTAFITGNAVGKPEGILTNAAVVAGALTSAANDVLGAADIIDAFYGLKDGYSRNATWVMRRATIGAVRKLVATTGDFLWQPGLQEGQPSRLLDRPVIEAKDMPVVADQALAVALGDFTRGYLIVDRVEIAVIRDPFTQAAGGNIRFHARKRVGGQVVNAEAIKLIKIQ